LPKGAPSIFDITLPYYGQSGSGRPYRRHAGVADDEQQIGEVVAVEQMLALRASPTSASRTPGRYAVARTAHGLRRDHSLLIRRGDRLGGILHEYEYAA
jgi:hypothetical protein